MEGLKPCPFCGKQKQKIDSKQSLYKHVSLAGRINNMTVSVRCMSCFARGPAIGGKVYNGYKKPERLDDTCILVTREDLIERAAKAWNKRRWVRDAER